jgi:hypothetical protein
MNKPSIHDTAVNENVPPSTQPKRDKRGRPQIKDEFTHLPVSRQRKWQLRNMAQGKCRICSQPVVGSSGLCLDHMAREREATALRNGAQRQNLNCKSRRLEALNSLSSHRWKHRVVSVRKDRQNPGRVSQDLLINYWGAMGWELVSAVPQSDGDTFLYFKKPVHAIRALAE